ncbi:MAG TPA: glucosaminidase domain-containing protein [Myxococcales bacterium]|jgi:peptidoglycan hydrolase-like protein with peptidoglycan-binding domain
MVHQLQRSGSRGLQVKDIQERLKTAGFDPGPVDGQFGPRTEAAVKKFQADKKLVVDGIVGPQTWGALDAFEDPKGPTGPRDDGSSTFNPGGVQGNTPVGNIPQSGNQFIDSVAADAIRSQRETGVPASVTMAQAILESGWGSSGLSSRANNYFGIKGEGPAGHVNMRTREVVNGQSVYVNANFRAYHSAQESFTDHGEFLRRNSRYANCFNYQDNPAQFCRELQRAGYATDPNYATALTSLIRRYHLERYDAIGRQ